MGREEMPTLPEREPAREARGTSSSPGAPCPGCSAGTCPKCGSKVPGVTLASLLTESAKARLASPEGFRFCGSPTCETVYWNPETGERFSKRDLRVRVGLKESQPPRPVCYCFGFTVEDIEAQVRATGTSTIPDEVTEKIRQKLCHCEDANPQGTCCLGNVRAALKAAQEKRGAQGDAVSAAPIPSSASEEPAHACCALAGSGPAVCVVPAEKPVSNAPVDARPRSDGHDCCAREAAPSSPLSPEGAASRAGILSSIGAVISAVVASACCWLPLVLIAFGVSAGSLASFFERYRLGFLGGAGLLLAVGFYFVYFRKEACGPGAACAVPNRRLQKLNRAVLWIATGLVVVAGAFPKFVSAFLGDGARSSKSVELGERAVYAIHGMTCEACAVTIRSELEKLPGIARAEVSFEEKKATISAAASSPLPAEKDVLDAIRRAGYEAEKRSVTDDTARVTLTVEGFQKARSGAT